MEKSVQNPNAILLPGAEEIYDFELDDLEKLLSALDSALNKKEYNPFYGNYEKFERKANKIRSLIELEISERNQVDDLLKFFIDGPSPDLVEEVPPPPPPAAAKPSAISSSNPFLKKPEDEKQTDASDQSLTSSNFGGAENKEESVYGSKTLSTISGKTPTKPPIGSRGNVKQKPGIKQGKNAKKALQDFMREKLAATREDSNVVMVVGRTTVKNPTIPPPEKPQPITTTKHQRAASKGAPADIRKNTTNNFKNEPKDYKKERKSTSSSKKPQKDNNQSRIKPKNAIEKTAKAKNEIKKSGKVVKSISNKEKSEQNKNQESENEEEGYECENEENPSENIDKSESSTKVEINENSSEISKTQILVKTETNQEKSNEIHEITNENKNLETEKLENIQKINVNNNTTAKTEKTDSLQEDYIESSENKISINSTESNPISQKSIEKLASNEISVKSEIISKETKINNATEILTKNPTDSQLSKTNEIKNTEISQISKTSVIAQCSKTNEITQNSIIGDSKIIPNPVQNLPQNVPSEINNSSPIPEKPHSVSENPSQITENPNLSIEKLPQNVPDEIIVSTTESHKNSNPIPKITMRDSSSNIILTSSPSKPEPSINLDKVYSNLENNSSKPTPIAQTCGVIVSKKGKANVLPPPPPDKISENNELPEAEIPENPKIAEAEHKIKSLQKDAQELTKECLTTVQSTKTKTNSVRPNSRGLPIKNSRPVTSQQKLPENKPAEPEEEKKTEKKPVIKKKPRPAPNSIPAHIEEAIIDYSKYYKSFFDIFNGFILDPKKFDLYSTAQDTFNIYKMYNTLLDEKTIYQFTFEVSPLEKTALDYFNYMKSSEMLETKEVSDRMLTEKNQNVEQIKKAMLQAKLQEKFKKLKEKNFITDEETESSKQIEKEITNLIDVERRSTLLYRVVKNREEVYDIVTKAFSRKSRWNEMPHGVALKHTWNLLWTWSKPNIDFNRLLVWQKVNHFPGVKNIARKDYLKRHLERCQNLNAKAAALYNFVPRTFLLPNEYLEMVDAFNKAEMAGERYNYWIMKPCAKSRGRGISVFNNVSQISYGEPMIVQEYLKNPLLLNGYKFDMRIYVLVTSFNPLEVFLYREGFARLSTVKFSLNPEAITNKFIHLTNSSVQEYSKTKKEAPDSTFSGTKISLEQLKDKLYGQNVEWSGIWQQVQEIVTKSLIACQIDIPYNPCCFELFGYDIIIDSNLKCWLIEVNSSPSLGILNLLDDIVKLRLMDDLIDLVDVLDFDRKRLEEVFNRRMKEIHKVSSLTGAQAQKMLNRDLTYILNGQEPREYGEMPKFMGGFERLAPSPYSEKVLRAVGGQKVFGKKVT